MLELFDFPRSSASYRVRIACNLKRLEVTKTLVNFREKAQRSPAYLKVSPSGLVPTLREEDGWALSQSIAILEYLDHLAPEPRLFPQSARARAEVMEMALMVACDIHPLNNLRILKYLENTLGADEAARDAWYAEWVQLGFEGLEVKAKTYGGPFCYGADLSPADLCLVPQMFNARRFNVDLSAFPTLVDIDARLTAIDAFAAAAPS
ncbi:MAG: maleylacetoacetate isomerase [Pseudomonadota bacterium]